MQKTCNKCLESKPLDEFYRNSSISDGFQGKCKECAKAYNAAHRAKKADYYREYDRLRARDPKRVNARREYAANAPYRPRPERDPVKRAARVALSNAIRDGKVTRPPHCEVCATTGDVHGHHDDYSKPLAVIWCCTACHALIHAYWRAQMRTAA